MRRLAPVLIVVWMSVVAQFAAQDSAVFRAETQTVPVYATVIGSDRRLVTDLTRESFQILDNGRPQKVTLFDAAIQPITIIVMLDTSGSMAGNLGTLRTAAVQMFTRLLPKDKARVGYFGNRIVISPKFTNDVNDLIRELWLDLEPGGGTPLWGAVNAAMGAMARTDGRRVVLVLSDGKNTGLRGPSYLPVGAKLDDVVERAQAEDFMVYAIGLRSSDAAQQSVTTVRGRSSRAAGGSKRGPATSGGPGGFSTASGSDEPDPGLQDLAAESGGGYFQLRGNEDLGAVFARVADELHRQYLLGYVAPEADGKLHQLHVTLNDPSMTVRARRSYVAPFRR